MNDIANIICQIFQYYIQQQRDQNFRYLFSTTGSLLQQINISLCRENSQNYMLAHTDFNKISIDNYKQESLPIFMLEDCVYVTCSLNPLYVEVIANIQC